jgi:branched-subunit amino acid aminotransferase/4-amino-4-deoxychorismate lyase
MLNELGSVASACMANLFWLRDGTMFTPALTTGCLAGTTRGFVLERMECREVEAAIESLEAAEAIFLTSAGLGVKSVSEFNGRHLPATSHPITSLIGQN